MASAQQAAARAPPCPGLGPRELADPALHVWDGWGPSHRAARGLCWEPSACCVRSVSLQAQPPGPRGAHGAAAGRRPCASRASRKSRCGPEGRRLACSLAGSVGRPAHQVDGGLSPDPAQRDESMPCSPSAGPRAWLEGALALAPGALPARWERRVLGDDPGAGAVHLLGWAAWGPTRLLPDGAALPRRPRGRLRPVAHHGWAAGPGETGGPPHRVHSGCPAFHMRWHHQAPWTSNSEPHSLHPENRMSNSLTPQGPGGDSREKPWVSWPSARCKLPAPSRLLGGRGWREGLPQPDPSPALALGLSLLLTKVLRDQAPGWGATSRPGGTGVGVQGPDQAQGGCGTLTGPSPPQGPLAPSPHAVPPHRQGRAVWPGRAHLRVGQRPYLGWTVWPPDHVAMGVGRSFSPPPREAAVLPSGLEKIWVPLSMRGHMRHTGGPPGPGLPSHAGVEFCPRPC